MGVPFVLGFALLETLVPSQVQAAEAHIRMLRDQSNAAIARHDVEAVLSFLDAEYQITAGGGSLSSGLAAEREIWQAPSRARLMWCLCAPRNRST